MYAHAVTGAPVKRAILQSGSLQLSPPQGYARGEALCAGLDANLSKQGFRIADAPVEVLLGAFEEAKIVSMWLQLTEDLHGWETRISHIDQLIVGMVEYESVIWRNGIESMTAAAIIACFDSAGDSSLEFKRLYNIAADIPTACKLGALDLINDTRFALPVTNIRDTYRKAGKPIYTYVFHEVNPWQASHRAHHAVDLLMLFGDLDFSHNIGAAAVRQDLRNKWLDFCNGQPPWSIEQTYAFGPHDRCGEIAASELEGRRRVRACALLEEMGPAQYNAVFGKLAAGRISLLN